MNENKIQVSFSLDPDNGAQMLALANFALTLVEAKTGTIPEKTVAAVERGAKEVSLPVEHQEVNEEPKRRKRNAAKTEQVEQAEPAEVESVCAGHDAETEAQEEQEAEAPKPVSKITMDDVRLAVAEKKETHLEIMKFKLKQDFGVTKTPDLKPEQYEAFYNFVKSL